MAATPKSAPPPRNGAGVTDPIADAVNRGDYDLFAQALAEDVVFRSPVSRFRFRGPEITSALFERLVKQSDPDRWGVQDSWSLAPDAHAMALTTNVRGHQLDLLIVTRLNERHQISQVTAYARPMASIAIFPAFVYPHLVERFRGPGRAAVVRTVFRPLPRLLKVLVSAGLGFGRPPQAEFEEAELPTREEPPAAPSAGPSSASDGGQSSGGPRPSSDGAQSPPAGPRSPFRRL
ncbi:MAG TPA: nuclear transport factor 2 family protein [Thermoleophilaceae bacterium]|jgi:hypothetical protein